MAWKLISLSLRKIRCKWEDYHHYGVISHEMVASLLIPFMRCASLFQPASMLLWPSSGQRSSLCHMKSLQPSSRRFSTGLGGWSFCRVRDDSKKIWKTWKLDIRPVAWIPCLLCLSCFPATPSRFPASPSPDTHPKPYSWPHFLLILTASSCN